MIKVLHKIQDKANVTEQNEYDLLDNTNSTDDNTINSEWQSKWRIMYWSFGVSVVYTLLSYFVPVLKSMPLFTWFGVPFLTEWNWTLIPCKLINALKK